MGRMFITYIMASRRSGTLHVGATGNPFGRIRQHRNGVVAGFSKHYGVRRLVWYEPHDSREYAIWRERQIKEWQRVWKIRLVEERNPDSRDLRRELTGER
jgi:putative endonuclease